MKFLSSKTIITFVGILVTISVITLHVLIIVFNVPLLLYQSSPKRFLIFTGVWFLSFFLLGILPPLDCRIPYSAPKTHENKMDKALNIMNKIVFLIIAIGALEGILELVLWKDVNSFIQNFYPPCGPVISLASRFLVCKLFLHKNKRIKGKEAKD